jgi:hypothetical protein
VSHVFISYKREDEVRVGRIARALEAAGIAVWWDRGLPGGESWHANIEANLDAAGCVIVVWSQGSVGPEGRYVRDEARRGLKRGILVPVVIDRVSAIPLGFGEVQNIDLRHWRGDPRDAFFRDLVATVRAKLEGAPAPTPRGPLARLARRMTLGGVSAVALALWAAFAFNAFGVATHVCTAPGFQPGLSDACGAGGIAGRPTRAERLMWEARPHGSCSALKAYMNRYPGGAYHRQAEDLWLARQVIEEDQWTPTMRPMPLTAVADGPVAPNRTAAEAAALTRAASGAERMCRGLSEGTMFRFIGAKPRAVNWSCHAEGAGTVCGFEGWADCALQLRQSVTREVCDKGA